MTNNRIELEAGVTIEFRSSSSDRKYRAVISGPVFYAPTPFGSTVPFTINVPVDPESVVGINHEHDGVIHRVDPSLITAVRGA